MQREEKCQQLILAFLLSLALSWYCRVAHLNLVSGGAFGGHLPVLLSLLVTVIFYCSTMNINIF